MKGLIVIVLLGVAAWFAYDKYFAGGANGAPITIRNPIYAEMRASTTGGGREIEMAVFARSASEAECRYEAREAWAAALKGCPTCTLQAPKCSPTLAPRYARLFDDVPIPSTYLSATAGNARERDARLVIYGLTDAEGVKICEELKNELAKEYTGKLACIPPSGG